MDGNVDSNKLQELGKKALKVIATVVILAVGATIVTALIDAHDYRIVLGMAAGYFLADPLYKLLGEIKALQ